MKLNGLNANICVKFVNRYQDMAKMVRVFAMANYIHDTNNACHNLTVCKDGRCEQEVDMFLNNFCASATPTTVTHTSIVTDTKTTPSISICTDPETETVTNEMNITVTSTMTTTKHSTITEVKNTTVTMFSTIVTTTTEMVNITPSAAVTVLSSARVSVSK